ncbi:MAG: hypothetical protein IH830_07745 [Planctomycetes bacterium]|nr:hypothetical protein [Planctomycetota bacterium]
MARPRGETTRLTTEPPRAGAVRGATPRLGTLCNGLCKAGDGIAGLARRDHKTPPAEPGAKGERLMADR